MKFINENLKKVGIVNSVLIVIAIALKIYCTVIHPHVNTILEGVFCIAALVCGFIYGLSGYKKDGAKYFKIFFVLYAAEAVMSAINAFIYKPEGMMVFTVIVLIAHIAVVLCALALALLKDIGKDNSTIIAFVNLFINVILLVAVCTSKNYVQAYVGEINNVVLSCIAFIFVSAKYKDKEIRGSK